MTNKMTVVMIGGVSLMRSFAKLPVNKILVARTPNDPALYSREYNQAYVIDDPVKQPDKVIDQLINIAKHCDVVPVLYYAEDKILLLISRNREKLLKHYNFLMPSSEVVEACSDKFLFEKLARKHDLLVPKCINTSEITNDTNIKKDFGFPCIVKPLLKEGRDNIAKIKDGKPQKALLIQNQEELINILEVVNNSNNDYILQEYVEGGEELIYSFHAFADENNNAIEYYVGKKIRTYPSVAGVSTFVELIDDPEVARLGIELLKNLKVTGPVKIDFKKDITRDKYYLLELNLRFNLWNALGAHCGINLAEIAYKYSNGIPYEPVRTYKTGICWLAFRDDYRAYVEDYGPTEAMPLKSWLLSLRRAKVYRVFSWRDPLPAIISSTRFWGKKIKSLFKR
jgi:D-aspartate ligase